MRIAILAHVRQRIAEPFMGGMESLTFRLAAGLVGRGHDVVLFASGDSDPRFAIDPVVDIHYEATFPWAEHRGSAPLIAHLDRAYADACDRIAQGKFDVLHNNALHRFAIERQRTDRVPTVTSLHVPPFDALSWFVRASPSPSHLLTVTSETQAAAWWPEGAPQAVSVLHNGVALAEWPFVAQGDGSAAWCGRITPEKGPHLAVAAARHAAIPLTLYGQIEDPGYWREKVAPHLGDGIRHAGLVEARALADAVGRASVFLFTPCWDEPFGLVAIEAMSCGLPVAAFDRGAAQEVVGEAGCLAPADDPERLALAMQEALRIPRGVPRARVEREFGLDLYLDRCEALYDRARRGRTA